MLPEAKVTGQPRGDPGSQTAPGSGLERSSSSHVEAGVPQLRPQEGTLTSRAGWNDPSTRTGCLCTDPHAGKQGSRLEAPGSLVSLTKSAVLRCLSAVLERLSNVGVRPPQALSVCLSVGGDTPLPSVGPPCRRPPPGFSALITSKMLSILRLVSVHRVLVASTPSSHPPTMHTRVGDHVPRRGRHRGRSHANTWTAEVPVCHVSSTWDAPGVWGRAPFKYTHAEPSADTCRRGSRRVA